MDGESVHHFPVSSELELTIQAIQYFPKGMAIFKIKSEVKP